MGEATSIVRNGYEVVNVLHIIGSLQLGGAESQVVTLAPALNQGRYAVSVCCLYHEGVQSDVLRARGIPVTVLNMRLRYWPIAVYRLYGLIRQHDVKIVHTHLYETGIWGRFVAKLAGVPIIVTTEHGMTVWKKWNHLLFERVVGRFTDKMIAVSEDIRQRRIEVEGVSPQQIVTIPNAVDVERFRKVDVDQQVRMQLGVPASSLLVGTVARLVSPKRLDYLLEAARIVCDAAPSTRFLIVGDGPLRESLQSAAERLGLWPGYVQFLGSRRDIPELLSAFDIFVISSEREGLPVSLLEALAASKPVVTTRVGGIPDVIEDGCTGLLVDPHDPPGLAEAILTLLEDIDLRDYLAEQGNQVVQTHFSTEAISRRIIVLYDELLKHKVSTNNAAY